MNRRSIIVLLIGVLSALAGLTTSAFVEQRRCLGAGGRWDSASTQCHLATHIESGFSARSITAGVIVGILAAVMLYRALLFITTRAVTRST